MMNGYLRPVLPEDKDLLYQWANDEQTRKNAFSSEPIPYENHETWFCNLMSSSEILQFIYYYNQVPIGQIRLNISGENANLDYSIESSYRGQGHGSNMLLLIENEIRNKYPNIKRLNAQIKDENISSKKIVEALNYKKSYIEFTKEL